MTLLLFFNLFLLSQVISTPDLLSKWKGYAFKDMLLKKEKGEQYQDKINFGIFTIRYIIIY